MEADPKRVQKDSAITTTPSTGASTSASYRPVTRGLEPDPNLTFGLDDSFMFRVFNVFRDQSRQGVIQILRRGHLHTSDVNTLVSEAEERDVMVSKLIAANVRTYRSK